MQKTISFTGFLNLLEGCRQGRVGHLVYASSSSVYGANTSMPYSVHQNVDHPVSLYAATKKAMSRAIFVGAKWLELGYNPKDLWSVSRIHKENPERADHPTQKPLEIIERMLLASCPPDGIVLDLFMGSGTTAVAAKRCGRNFVGFELNSDYCDIIQTRLASPESDRVALRNQPSEPIRAKAPKISPPVKAKRARKSLTTAAKPAAKPAAKSAAQPAALKSAGKKAKSADADTSISTKKTIKKTSRSSLAAVVSDLPLTSV